MVADLNIGDAVNLQVAVRALRHFFPDARIDYVFNRLAEPLIQGNPGISSLLPVLSGSPVPDDGDVKAMEGVVLRGEYDAVINFCPFFYAGDFGGGNGSPVVIGPDAMVYILLYGVHRKDLINHVLYQADHFIHAILSDAAGPEREGIFRGTNVYLSDDAVAGAGDFLAREGVLSGTPILFYNPDATSPFTRIPLHYQADLLGRLLESDREFTVLVGAGHVEIGIEQALLEALPAGARGKIHVVPRSTPLDRYVALIDLSDVFITGDTGPMHLAAARKKSRSGGHAFRNRTTIFSIFGATPARVYGYDSNLKGYLPSNQNAPSSVYISRSPCRNVTCVNKRAKTCRKIRCFEDLDTERIARDVVSYLTEIGKCVSPESGEGKRGRGGQRRSHCE